MQSVLKKRVLLQVYHKILLAFFIAVLVIYAIGLSINMRLEREIQNSLLSSIEAKANYLSIELSNSLEHIKSLCNYTVIRYSVRKLVLYNKTNTIGDILDEMRLTREILSSITNSSGLASGVAVILPELEIKITSYSYSEPLTADDYALLDAYASGGRENRILVWKDRMFFLFPIYSPNDQNNDYPAALAVELSRSAIRRYISVSAGPDRFDLAVLINGALVVSGTSPQDSAATPDTFLKVSQIPLGGASAAGRSQTRIGGRTYWVLNNQIAAFDTKIVALVNAGTLTREINQPQSWSILFTVIAGLAFVSFLLIVNRLITRPISQFTKAINRLKHDEVLQFEYGGNEFNAIYQAFNDLAGRLRAAIEQVYNQKMLVHKAEIKYLQAQINPHFLYNSFFHLYQMSMMEDLEGVAEMSVKLGRYYQYITRSSSSIVPLEREYENARDYADIQSIRFGTRISAHFSDIPEECRKTPVPKFILQPILENAYKHGFDKATDKGMLRVDVAFDGDRVAVTVEDNGGGMGADDLHRICQYLDESGSGGEITGLQNTKIRLTAYGGSLDVSAGAMGGMKVIIRIPIRNEEQRPDAEEEVMANAKPVDRG